MVKGWDLQVAYERAGASKSDSIMPILRMHFLNLYWAKGTSGWRDIPDYRIPKKMGRAQDCCKGVIIPRCRQDKKIDTLWLIG